LYKVLRRLQKNAFFLSLLHTSGKCDYFIVALKWEGIATPFQKGEREAGENQPKIG